MAFELNKGQQFCLPLGNKLLHSKVWKSLSRVLLFATPCLYSLWNSPGQNTGVGSLSLPQGIFPTQGLNPGLPHGRRILYQLSHKGSPRILEWVAYPFSRRSSQCRKRTRVSCIAGRFFTNWAMREALIQYLMYFFCELGGKEKQERSYRCFRGFLPKGNYFHFMKHFLHNVLIEFLWRLCFK